MYTHQRRRLTFTAFTVAGCLVAAVTLAEEQRKHRPAGEQRDESIISMGKSVFGDGSDGDMIVSVDMRLERDMNFRDLTVTRFAILDTAGYAVRVAGNLLNLGEITDRQSGGYGGAGGAPGYGGLCDPDHVSPASGDCGHEGYGPCCRGGNGGVGGDGGGGGGAAWRECERNDFAPIRSQYCQHGGAGGYGGAGGRGGGYVLIFASNFANYGLIHADGEAGMNGEIGKDGEYGYYWLGSLLEVCDGVSGAGGGGAGGAGGDGGIVQVFYRDLEKMGMVYSCGGPGGRGADCGRTPCEQLHCEPDRCQLAEYGGTGCGVGGAGMLSSVGSSCDTNLYYGQGGHGRDGELGTVSVRPWYQVVREGLTLPISAHSGH